MSPSPLLGSAFRAMLTSSPISGSPSTPSEVPSRVQQGDHDRSRLVSKVRSLLTFWLYDLPLKPPPARSYPTVEAAEERLVNATEEAINLMRSVLDNPEPIRNLAALVKAQQAFYAEAAEVSLCVSRRLPALAFGPWAAYGGTSR